jgi:methyltransferase (TIGR00027 family)
VEMLGGARPSLTAMVVASARFVAGMDDVAPRLVPRSLGRPLEAALRRASLGLVPHIGARTATIDAVVRRQHVPQLVVLGAGLDARAHRLPALAPVDVFEVDHPSTQAFKRRRTGGLPIEARALRYVAVDFERDDLGERLSAAGHSASQPTTWIWEGVTMYLTIEAVRTTLAAVAARSAVGTTLVLTYATPELSVGSAVLRSVGSLVRPAFGLLGEPLRFLPSSAAMAALLGEYAFEVLHDLPPTSTIAERVLIAIRQRTEWPKVAVLKRHAARPARRLRRPLEELGNRH